MNDTDRSSIYAYKPKGLPERKARMSLCRLSMLPFLHCLATASFRAHRVKGGLRASRSSPCCLTDPCFTLCMQRAMSVACMRPACRPRKPALQAAYRILCALTPL